MKYDFNTVLDRKNTNSLKYDFHSKYLKRENLIPLWVADMDFKVPKEVEEALIKCAKHGIFGYSDTKESYFEAVKNWFVEGFEYYPEERWLIKTPGVVFALAQAVRAFSDVGDAVMIQRPVYHPFSEVVINNGRKLINNALVYENGRYLIDFDDFERKIVENKVKLFILCSPHNPTGRVWQRDELEKMGDICLKYDCLVVSDEIHCDFVCSPHKHVVFSTIKPEFADISVICTAPSKTFNLPGLQASNVFISNANIRKKFSDEYRRSGYSQLNVMGLVACESAYRYGRDWLNRLIEYLAKNMKLVYEFGEKTGIKPVALEGTYLAWLDFSPLGLSHGEIESLVADKAGLWLSSGTTFGNPEGLGFQRVNIACPRSVLETALGRLEDAVRGL
jgi:cystathionine beta-lyase